MSVIDYGNTYHLSKLIFFSSNPEDWNYNKLKIEDIDPYLNKPFNYNSSYIVYNGLKYCNEIFIKELLKYFKADEDLLIHINNIVLQGSKTKYYYSLKLLKHLFLCILDIFNNVFRVSHVCALLNNIPRSRRPRPDHAAAGRARALASAWHHHHNARAQRACFNPSADTRSARAWARRPRPPR